jgi:chromosome segregation ATPase
MATLKKRLADDMARLQSQHESAMEAQRSTYELKIDELELSLRKCQQTIVKLEGTVLSLNTHLTEKADVEK